MTRPHGRAIFGIWARFTYFCPLARPGLVTENFPSTAKRRRRGLSAAELELWFEATRSVVPRPGRAAERPQAKADSGLKPREAPLQPPKGARSDEASRQAAPKMPRPLAPIE